MRRRRAKLYAFIATAFLLFIVFLHGRTEMTVAVGHSPSDDQLEAFMNRHTNSKNYTLESPFDWLDAPIRYSSEKTLTLPSAKPSTLPRVQADFPAESSKESHTREVRRKAVVDTFQKSWKSYRKSAWMKDEYKPISNEGKDNWGGWAATLIDTLDTLWIMGLEDEFREAVDAVAKINFGNCTEVNVSVFETTIRYLGGLIGAYDLSGEDVLLQQAIQVGEMLLRAFDTPNGMPIDRLDITKAKEGGGFKPDGHICIAGVGSMTMEFVRLAQITGNSKYYHAVAWITMILDYNQPYSLIPGLFPTWLNARTLSFNDSRSTTFGIGAMADSTFEYFAKTHALLGGLEPAYEKLYRDSMDQIDTHLLFRPMLPNNPDILFAGDLRIPSHADPAATILDPSMQHLSCFAGGMYALGGKLFNNAAHVALGAKLTDGCVHAYALTPSGIMPEIFESVPCASRSSCAFNETAWGEAVTAHYGPKYSFDAKKAAAEQRLPVGMTSIKDYRYMLRPEAIESVFVLYRVTGDPKYREAAWGMFEAIVDATATEGGNAAVEDVTVKRGELVDSMETFWLAETLKYFYLIFSREDLLSLDKWVFNTEAHPFRRPV
ncbi:seven-hairpin glycosidase [Lophium mytilinum]|uniref:alpha-1,2-Mannosidase n=1 Tax=Lophium mytilinum TaxID=390894 RepID=A0A6A6QAQ0_9PEZI|nr:seven-hairpin glycosidase [Lophium mytilinum]